MLNSPYHKVAPRKFHKPTTSSFSFSDLVYKLKKADLILHLSLSSCNYKISLNSILVMHLSANCTFHLPFLFFGDELFQDQWVYYNYHIFVILFFYVLSGVAHSQCGLEVLWGVSIGCLALGRLASLGTMSLFGPVSRSGSLNTSLSALVCLKAVGTSGGCWFVQHAIFMSRGS